MLIYKSVNKINGKLYIGKTVGTLKERKKDHEKTQSNTLFHKAIIKYGIKNFKWFIIEKCTTEEDLTKKEEYYIKKINSHFIDGYGYNMTYGGEIYPRDYMNNLWKDEQFKKKHAIATGKATKESWKNEETREKRSKGISKARKKQYKEDEIYRKKILNHIKGQAKRNWNDKEYRKKVLKNRSKIVKKNWENEDFRRKILKGRLYYYVIENVITNKIFEFYGYDLKKFCYENNIKHKSFTTFLSTGNKKNCYKNIWRLLKKCQKNT